MKINWILTFKIKSTEPNNVKVSGENIMFCAADALQWYHPASNTCVLSLPALHRQEVVTDDRGSSYPEGIHFTHCRLDFWWQDGSEDIIRSSGDPRNSYLCTTCQLLSAVLKEAISQCECYIRWSPCCQKMQPTWSTFCCRSKPELTSCISPAPMMHFSVSVLCDAGASALRNSLTPLPPVPNETPYNCLYYEGCIPIERHERGDRLSLRDFWSPPLPKPSNAPLTVSQIMGLINI